MFVEMTCSCEAHLQIDSEMEDAVWLLALRFANAHSGCGFVTPTGQADEVTHPQRHALGPMDLPETDEEDAETMGE